MSSLPSSASAEPGGNSRQRRHRRKHGRTHRKQVIRNIIMAVIGATICGATYYYWQHLVG
jgi:hypothetical protein